MPKLISAFAALALMASPVTAEKATTEDGRPEAAKKDKLICKRIKDIQWRTASHRVCFTAAKWRQIAQQMQQDVDDYGRSGSFGDLNDN